MSALPKKPMDRGYGHRHDLFVKAERDYFAARAAHAEKVFHEILEFDVGDTIMAAKVTVYDALKEIRDSELDISVPRKGSAE